MLQDNENKIWSHCAKTTINDGNFLIIQNDSGISLNQICVFSATSNIIKFMNFDNTVHKIKLVKFVYFFLSLRRGLLSITM